MTTPPLPEQIELHRDRRWRRDEDLRIESAVDAERFIEDVGFANTLTDARRAGPSFRQRGVVGSAILLRLPFDLAGSLRRLSTSCEAAVRTKPKARLCGPWVNVVINLFGAAERRPKYFGEPGSGLRFLRFSIFGIRLAIFAIQK